MSIIDKPQPNNRSVSHFPTNSSLLAYIISHACMKSVQYKQQHNITPPNPFPFCQLSKHPVHYGHDMFRSLPLPAPFLH